MGGNDASDEWKDGRDFELPYTGLVDRGDYKITGLHPVFCALLFTFMYTYTYIYIFINKYT